MLNAGIGLTGVALGLGGSLAGAVSAAVGARTGRSRQLRWAAGYSIIVGLGAIVAVVAMERALITRDFSLRYIAQVGSTRTPALFNVAAMWSALEGSILLWALILSGSLVAVVYRFRHRLTEPLVGWALVTMFVICAFFFALMAGPVNPFRLVAGPQPLDGPGPNPLLQNHVLMAFHPPMLYLGYVGFSVPFAFAIGALVTGRVGDGWLVITRRWTLFAWGFLTLGIMLGAGWSYEVLGWGGCWAWDPVENASLLPWLTATAYIHSILVQERRGMLRVWNLSLLCATFSLTILGTFLTRSGVLNSVHAFSESDIGPAILGFFALIVLVSIALIAWRGEQLRSAGAIDAVASREGAFLANNALFALFAAVVLLGTVFPLVIEALRGQRISVGRPYFDRMAVPLGLSLLTLMAIAPVLPWRKASHSLLRSRLLGPAASAACAAVVAVVLGARGFVPVVAFALAGAGGGAALRQLILNVRRHGWRGVVGSSGGGMIVHLGVVIIAIAITASGSYSRRAQFEMQIGQQVSFAGHTFVFESIDFVTTRSRNEKKVLIRVDGTQTLAPSLQQFNGSNQTVGTPAVASSLREDIYLTALDLPADDVTARIGVLIMPMAVWLWTGGAVIGFGTVLSAIPRRRQRRKPAVDEPRTDRTASTVDDELLEPAGVS
ncbi:MAG: heme lyase CcmF/NrfE family subunit [Ilumatobacteraceae bacterium]